MMRFAARAGFFAVVALVVLVPPQRGLDDLAVRRIDRDGNDTVCPPEFAYAKVPDRSDPHPLAAMEDFAYAAAEAGPLGTGTLLLAIALLALVSGLWAHGLRCGLRRMLVTFGVGVPLCIGMLYASSFLEGRDIALGPDADAFVKCSLHTQTDRTTGILSPRELVAWHAQRGFRVLNVSDRDGIAGAVEAQRIAMESDAKESLLVLVGEEWHGHPDLVLVNVARSWDPDEFPADERIVRTVRGVREQHGAVFIAHPWAKLDLRLEDALRAGVDGVEAVNGIIHGGDLVLTAARREQKALLGVLDYKFGPHVSALTLIRAIDATSPRAVVGAIRDRRTIVLYAIPGGPISGAGWDAAYYPGLAGAMAGLRSLAEVPWRRRLVWVGWIWGVFLLWWVSGSGAGAREGGIGKPLGAAGARTVLIVCCVIEFVLPAGLSWQVRALVGPIPLRLLLGAAAVVAVPLLAASRILSRREEQA